MAKKFDYFFSHVWLFLVKNLTKISQTFGVAKTEKKSYVTNKMVGNIAVDLWCLITLLIF